MTEISGEEKIAEIKLYFTALSSLQLLQRHAGRLLLISLSFHIKVLLVAIRDFFVCGAVVFFDDSEIGYGLFFKIHSIVLFYLCNKDLLHFFG